ncbi:hypothetical protein GGR50DRAFT_229180 [Xylaria sp. CBS 124048]|nr:hypothetical protein GGR50DRAFT_229180 [Xylaria sp. CBS 124048]
MAPIARLIHLLKDEKSRDKLVRTATTLAEKAAPLVKTIEAGYAEYCNRKMLNNANSLTSRAADIVDKVKEFTPSIQVMGASFADSIKIFAAFSSMATSAGIAANIVLTYQGVKALQLIDARLKDMATSLAAQTALTAQRDFPQYVHNMIRERIMQTSADAEYQHWFFLYHPDNDWYPAFYHIMQEHPVGPEFCGYTNQIDTAFVFMLAVRRRILKREQRARRKEKDRDIRPIKMHLLIPAYQPVLILEALKIPEAIGDFVIEGRINSNRPFVWLNLPDDQKHYVQDIGNFIPPPQGLASWAMSLFGLAQLPPKLGERRVLGAGQGLIENDEYNNSDSEEEQDASQPATPIQQQHRRRRHDKKYRSKK